VHDIGENRVQEAASKRELVANVAHWHLIGHLQTNKAARAAAMFDAVHSIDSARVATALARHRPEQLQPLALLMEIEFTGIAGRTGVGAADAETLLRDITGLPRVHLLGLMTIAPPVENVNDARPFFAKLRTLRDTLEARCGWPLPELSMGMSSDFEVAVEEGATMVRIGTAIFGPRQPEP
jgi:pyridoxal phosphate enzyme (YggS family)